jgi:starch synthase (maltosyl-transferring)
VSAGIVRRVVIERIRPQVDGGRFPVKRTVGEDVAVTATIFADGHDVLGAVLRDRPGRDAADAAQATVDLIWRETPMYEVSAGTDEWTALFSVHDVGWHQFQVVAWVDRFLTWRSHLRVKATAGQDVSVELLEGALLVRDGAARATDHDAVLLLERADALTDAAISNRLSLALDDQLALLMAQYPDRSRATASAPTYVWVDRERARFGSWYEMFPRSAGADSTRSATFGEAADALIRIADLGFDIVYLPPIHPIGRSFRKGRNNAPAAAPEDPGSPWAIGSEAGGHTAVEPGLGTLEDFNAFRAEAERLGLEIALDLAWQASPDHPWVHEHPEWFRHRPDGTIKYAENPPKKYQDIYPFDFENEDWPGLWSALLEVTRFWIRQGIRVFRVDNPHTKPLAFWSWFIAQIHDEFPDVILLSEAFTRPPVMRYLAKAGFTQSYTYFTWRNTKAELTDYLRELTRESIEYLRPNLFANTPDILHAYLQHGGRPAFEARLLLAATLGASYGIYSGFEICEARALRPGSEEYADSEKYQYRPRDWRATPNISELIRRVNEIRRAHPALQQDRTLAFHATDNDQIIAYSKTSSDGSDRVLAVVNLDPHHTQHGFVDVPVDEPTYEVTDLLDDTAYTWHRGWNYVRFDPEVRQGHVLWLPKPHH